MKALFIFLLFFIVGFILIIGYVYWAHQQGNLFAPNSTITTKFSLTTAPANSLKGNITTMSGVVTWLPRIGKNSIQLSNPRMIQQGEDLGTGKDGNATVTIQNANISLLPNSDVNFIQLLPQDFVFGQDKGIVTYENNGQHTMSITSLDLLTALNNGSANISVDPDTQTVTVMVEKGSVTEGYEDLQNNSNVVTITAGNKFVFDDVNKTGTVL